MFFAVPKGLQELPESFPEIPNGDWMFRPNVWRNSGDCPAIVWRKFVECFCRVTATDLHVQNAMQRTALRLCFAD